MSDEAIITTYLGNAGDPVEVTVLDANAIPKGSLLELTGSPQTCTIAVGVNGIFMGICDTEKVANDGITKVNAITNCVADLTCGAAEAMVLGQPVMIGAVANEVTTADAATIEGSAQVVGIAMETVAGNGIGAVRINKGHTYT